MPIYDFRCSECSNTFDMLVRSSDTPSCPSCGSTHLEKLLSIPAPPSVSQSDAPACGMGCGPGGCMYK